MDDFSRGLPFLTKLQPNHCLIALRLHLAFVQKEKVKVTRSRAHWPEETAAYSLVPHCLGITSS